MGRRKRRNVERDKKIVALWNSGMTAREVAEEMGLTPTAVQSAIKKRRMAGEMVRDGLLESSTIERDEEVLQLWNDGLNCPGIAEHLDLDKKVVRSAIKRARLRGEEVRSFDADVLERNARIVSLWNDGYNTREIVDEHYDYTLPVVWRAVQRGQQSGDALDKETHKQKRYGRLVALICKMFVYDHRNVFEIAHHIKDFNYHNVADILRQSLSDQDLIHQTPPRRRLRHSEDWVTPMPGDPPCMECQGTGIRLIWKSAFKTKHRLAECDIPDHERTNPWFKD